MGEVVAFPRLTDPLEEVDVDLLTAVDVAIRDLREIASRSGCAWSRETAEMSRDLLQQAFRKALDQ